MSTLIIIGAVVLVLIIFSALWLFTDIFSPNADVGISKGVEDTVIVYPGRTEPETNKSVAEPSSDDSSPEESDLHSDEPGLDTEISPGGGTVQVSVETSYLFTPGYSGVWEIITSDSGDNDPYLKIFDTNDIVIADDDDSAGDGNAILVVYLTEGETYRIHANFLSGDGSYTLTVSPAMTLPSAGVYVNVQGATGFSFTPDQSGKWEVSTTNNGSYDPIVYVLGNDNEVIDYDDDSGEANNAFLVVELTEGETYIIIVVFWATSQESSVDLIVDRQR